MLNYLRSFLRNEKYIFEIVCVIIFAIIFTRILNNFYKDTDIYTNMERNTEVNSSIYENITEEQTKESESIIDEFVELCKNKAYSDAYALLSYECKDLIYNNEKDFEEQYCQKYIADLEEYTKNSIYYKDGVIIYEIQYYPNFLETGEASARIDYIGVVKEKSGEEKLNLLGLINKKIIDKKYDDKNITIAVKSKIYLYQCELYNIEIVNKTDDIIEINPKDIMFIDGASKTYLGSNVIEGAELKIPSHEQKEVQIKIDKKAYDSETIETLQINKWINDTREIKINL